MDVAAHATDWDAQHLVVTAAVVVTVDVQCVVGACGGCVYGGGGGGGRRGAVQALQGTFAVL